MKIVWVKSICGNPFKGPCRVLVRSEEENFGSIGGYLFKEDGLKYGKEYYKNLCSGEWAYNYCAGDILNNVYEIMRFSDDVDFNK